MTRIAEAREEHLQDILVLDKTFSPVFATSDRYAELLRKDGLILVALHESELVAFAAFTQVMDEASLLNLVVHQRLQRRSIARDLLREAWQSLIGRGVVRVLLEVRQSNGAAQQLYRSEGFTEDGVRANYYPVPDGSREAAVLMSRNLEI